MQRRSFAAIRDGGTLVSTLEPEVADRAIRGIRVPERWHARPNTVELGKVGDLIDAGKLRVTVSRHFPLEEARTAYAFAKTQHPRGKVVLIAE